MFIALDESGIQPGSPWMAFGALWIPDEEEAIPYLSDAEARIRLEHRYFSEFKWSKLGDRYADAYGALVDAAFEIPDLSFTVMVLETSTVDAAKVREYNGEDGRTLAYLKFMSLMLRHRTGPRIANGHRSFTLVYDDVSGRQELKEEFDSVLRHDLANAAASARAEDCEYAHISKGNSAALTPLQVVDLLTGATRSAWMGEDDEYKREVGSRIETWGGQPLTQEHGGTPLDVWLCRLPKDPPTPDPAF